MSFNVMGKDPVWLQKPLAQCFAVQFSKKNLNPNPRLTSDGAGGLFHMPVKKAVTVSDLLILLPLATV